MSKHLDHLKNLKVHKFDYLDYFEKNVEKMSPQKIITELSNMKDHINTLKQTRNLINEQLADLYNELEAVRRKK